MSIDSFELGRKTLFDSELQKKRIRSFRFDHEEMQEID